ncbi:methyltransferase family protein [Bacillus oleivorans]|uniref:Methyltransferase family protein n=2 Tax=Bacillus oleivorans TaxID=1448271 RepID=A0A285CMF1_9BACI|nr:methyltransferase family protein [Bacillus oleivorans]
MAFNWQDESQLKWNDMAEYWNQTSESMWEKGSRKDIIPFIKGFVPPGRSICDLGCGDGYGSLLLAKHGYSVVGIDLAKEMIEKAKQRIIEDNIRFIQGSMTETPFADEEFDGVMAINSVEWNESPLLALKEMARITKTNGFACVGILGPTAAPRVNSYDRLYGKPAVCHTVMPWEFSQLAKENGWELAGNLPVYKREVKSELADPLPLLLKQALSFMWVVMLKKIN